MKPAIVEVTPDVRFDQAPVCICGPCVVEGREITLRIAEGVVAAAAAAGLPVIFKASFDKANRTSVEGFRGIGMDAALRVLEDVHAATGMPVITDIHHPEQAAVAAEVAHMLQVPAFLCRQTDLLLAAAATGRPVNIKKGQFVAPGDMRYAVEKARQGGARGVTLTERGSSFGYRELIVDFRSLGRMRELGCPVIFDATHAVQRPSGRGDHSGGDRTEVPPLLRAACAVGVDGVFLEVHEDPGAALSDGPNSIPLAALPQLLTQVQRLTLLTSSFPADSNLLS